jgi:hypothetical protein
MSEALTLTSPTDVVSAIPALLGFHPSDSLVALWLDPDRGRLVCTMRTDLGTPPEELTRQLIDATARFGPVKLLTVAYPVLLAGWIDSPQEQGVRAVLEDHVRRYCLGSEPTRWLFTAIGNPPHANSVGHLWRKASKAAGVDGLTMHSMRHYASGLIASGCDVVTVQRALGHARATTTLNTYSHMWPTAEDRTRRAALMDSVFAASEASATRNPADSGRTMARLQAPDLYR